MIVYYVRQKFLDRIRFGLILKKKTQLSLIP